MTTTAELKSVREELEQTRHQLQDTQFIFDNILESSLAGYWDWHIKDNYEYLSPTFKKMFGYEDHELPNNPETWQKIIHPEDLPKVFENFNLHVQSKGKVPYFNEVRYFHKDGTIVWVFCKGKVIEWDEEGNPVRMVGCHVDITQLKAAEATRKYARLLEKKNKELEQFAYIASHDLQEPLRTVTSFSDLFKAKYRNQFDEKAFEYLNHISAAGRRMGKLVQGLLEFSRIGEEGKPISVDLNEVLETVRADLTTIISERKAEIEVGELPKVVGYKTELRLLFQNLITNAIKYSKKDLAPKVRISAESEKEHWKFSCQDNGIGIEPRHFKKIFLIFQHLNNRKTYDGAGIGLAHCQKIVDLHDGKIWVDSEPNVGSTFHFTIPH